MCDKDNVSRSLLVDAHTVMDLIGINKDRVAFVKHDGLSVHGVGHLALRDGTDLDILMKMGNSFPGNIRFDPAFEYIRRKLRIVVIHDLRAVFPLYDQSHDVPVHNIPHLP